MNKTTVDQHIIGFETLIFFWTCFAIECLAIIIGNALLCCLFVRQRKLRTPSNFFILSLSVCDLLVGLAIAPCEYCAYIKLRTGVYTSNCAYFCGSVTSFNMFASVVNLSLIAADRYCSINKPFVYEALLTKRTSALIIACGWLVSLFLACVPFIWIFNYGLERQRAINKIYTISMFLCLYAIGALIFSNYYRVVKFARRKLREDSNSSRKNTKGIKVCVLVAVIFFVCWVPTSIVELLLQYEVELRREIPYSSHILLLLTPVLDPLLYAYYRTDFRAELTTLLKTICQLSTSDETITTRVYSTKRLLTKPQSV